MEDLSRHLPRAKVGKVISGTINQYLAAQGLLFREGSIVDAIIIEAPSSTKNATGKRDPEMHQARKGKQWHFGMKMHIGVDDTQGLIHTVATTPDKVSDVVMTDQLSDTPLCSEVP